MLPSQSLSPILVRPVREQFEHDRVIRLLHTRWRRRYEVGVNLSGEPTAPLRFGVRTLFPDLILTTNDRARRLHCVVEVETYESLNYLEAMAQWIPFARVRAPFHLYVPIGGVETAKRLCAEKGIVVDEIWSYHTVGSEVRFTLARRAPAKAKTKRKAKAHVKGRTRAKARTTGKAKQKTSAKGARKRPARAMSVKSSKGVNRVTAEKPSTGTRAAKGRTAAGRAATRTTPTARRPTVRRSAGKRGSRR